MAPAMPSPQSVTALHEALYARLRRRASLLMDEVRRYPGPIARCDEQLSALLEQRSSVFQALELLERASARGLLDEDAASLAMLAECLRPGAPEDSDADLAEHLSALRDEWRSNRGGCGPADAWLNDGGPVRRTPCAS
jgi:hypothetical protein